MGYSLSWLALEDADGVVAAECLGLEQTSERSEPGEAPLVGAALPGGWYLVVADRCDHLLVSDPVVRVASRDRAVVAVSLEEHVMVSVASLWSASERRWRVSHRERDEDVRDLAVSGEPPSTLAAVVEEARRAQDHEPSDANGVDHFFDVPLVLARQLAGFKHDDFPTPGVDGAFVALRAVPGGALAGARRLWWRFW
jgi:hypothetical protein